MLLHSARIFAYSPRSVSRFCNLYCLAKSWQSLLSWSLKIQLRDPLRETSYSVIFFMSPNFLMISSNLF